MTVCCPLRQELADLQKLLLAGAVPVRLRGPWGWYRDLTSPQP